MKSSDGINCGKIVTSMELSPSNESIILASFYGAGIYRTMDGGKSWVAVNNGLGNLEVEKVVFDPKNNSIAYASTNSGLYKTNDMGNTWFEIGKDIPCKDFDSIIVNKINPQILICTTWTNGVYISENGGLTWREANTGLNNPACVPIAIDPIDTQTLYVGCWTGVYKSTNNGQSWFKASNGLTCSLINSIAVDPINDSVIYIATGYGGVYKSTNGGFS